jgi:hypothetical protein
VLEACREQAVRVVGQLVTDEPGMDPETWDERDGAAADRAVSLTAMNAMRQMMGLAPLPTPSA